MADISYLILIFEMDVLNSWKLKSQSKKAMLCVSRCHGHHSARFQNDTEASTFSYVVSSLPKLSFYLFLFVLTQLLFCWYRCPNHSLSRSPFSSFSLTDSQLQLWWRVSHVSVICGKPSFGEICQFRRVARSYRSLGKRSFLSACCFKLKTNKMR